MIVERITRVVKSALMEHFFVEFNEEPGIKEYFIHAGGERPIGIHMGIKVIDRGDGATYQPRYFDVVVTERVDPFAGQTLASQHIEAQRESGI